MERNIILSGRNSLRNFIFIILCIFVVCHTFFPGCSKKDNLGKSEVKEPDSAKIIKTDYGFIPANQFLIILDEKSDRKEADKIAREYGGSVVGEIEFINLFQIETGFNTEKELVNAITETRKKNGVLNAVVNGVLKLRQGKQISCDPLDDPIYNKEKKTSIANEMINLKEAWKLIKASGIELSEVNVGVNDDELGFRTGELNISGNKELNEKMENWIQRGYSTKSDISVETHQKHIRMPLGHSNSVINIIAANNKNGGISGVASVLGDKIKINHINSFEYNNYGLKVAQKDGEDEATLIKKGSTTYMSTLLADLQSQIKNGSQIINCSYGTTDYNDKEMAKAFKKYLNKMAAEHPDVIFVGAGGNDNKEITGENDYWGSKSPNLITVGFINEDGSKNKYSNYAGGDGEITLATYGAVLQEDGQMNAASSYCAPQVSGVIALMKALNPKLSASEIKKILVNTATKNIDGKPVDSRMGAGCLNASDAVFAVIKDLKKDENLTKESLLNLADIELVAKGGPKEFTVTASINAASKKGTTLSIDIVGSNYLLNGSNEKSINSAGSVSWDITLGEESKGVTVTVKRLDTDGCAIIFISNMPEIILKGELNGILNNGDVPTEHIYPINCEATLTITNGSEAVLKYSYKSPTMDESGSRTKDPKYAILTTHSGDGVLTGTVDVNKGNDFELNGSQNFERVSYLAISGKNSEWKGTLNIRATCKFKGTGKDSGKIIIYCDIQQNPKRIRGDFYLKGDLK